MITVLFDAHNLGEKAGGIEVYNQNLIEKLKRNNLKLHLYLNNNFKQSNDDFVPRYDHGLYRIFCGFKKAADKFKPDIIHCNNFLPLPVPRNTKKVITLHDICFLNEKAFGERFLLTKLIKYSISNSDHIIANSCFTKNSIVQFCHQKGITSKISVVRHGVGPRFRPINRLVAKRFIAKKFNLENDFLLFSGNLTKRKNLPVLISIANDLKTKSSKTKIVITGKLMFPSFSIPENFQILNYIPQKDLNYLYNASLGLIYPSICEGFGLPILEASRTKTPVICSSIPTFKEIAKNAVLFANSEKDWLRNTQLLLNRIYPKELINKAYKNSLTFSWATTAKETFDIYQKLV